MSHITRRFVCVACLIGFTLMGVIFLGVARAGNDAAPHHTGTPTTVTTLSVLPPPRKCDPKVSIGVTDTVLGKLGEYVDCEYSSYSQQVKQFRIDQLYDALATAAPYADLENIPPGVSFYVIDGTIDVRNSGLEQTPEGN